MRILLPETVVHIGTAVTETVGVGFALVNGAKPDVEVER
jgi:hypothetical protein